MPCILPSSWLTFRRLIHTQAWRMEISAEARVQGDRRTVAHRPIGGSGGQWCARGDQVLSLASHCVLFERPTKLFCLAFVGVKPHQTIGAI